jgi:hypothetical protein
MDEFSLMGAQFGKVRWMTMGATGKKNSEGRCGAVGGSRHLANAT